jgi:hypothetical protein
MRRSIGTAQPRRQSVVPTVTSLKRARARADRDRRRAACCLTKMQGGVTLHLYFEKSGSTWRLLDGTKISHEIAKIVTSNLNVTGAGDCLFPFAPSVSQTFRWLD